MERRGPAPADQKAVAGQCLGGHNGAIFNLVDPHRFDAQAARGAGCGITGKDRDPACGGFLDKVGIRGRAGVDNGLDLRSGRCQIKGGIPCTVMAGDDDGIVSDTHAIAVQVGLRRPGQHHARTVIAIKYQWFFKGTLRQNDLFGADPPHPFPRGAGGRVFEMIGQFLTQADHVLMVIANCCGAGHDPHTKVGQGIKLGLQPVPCRFAVNFCLRFA